MSPPNTTVILERRYIPKGQILIKEGEAGQQAYLIQSGEVSVFIHKDGADVELSRLGPGQIVGEMAFISDAPRIASVKATQDCNLIVIGRTQFQDKLKETDPTIRAIVHMLVSRITESNSAVLNRKSDLKDLKETARIIFENVAQRLTPAQARTFHNTVLPDLEAFIDSLDRFKDRYGDDIL